MFVGRRKRGGRGLFDLTADKLPSAVQALIERAHVRVIDHSQTT